MHESCCVSREITAALNHDEPVVALESSVIAQGLPAGANIKAASIMQNAVKANGAVPAVIGLVDGKIKVGLDDDEINRLASEPAEKVGVSNLPFAVWKKQTGGMTVSATVRIASAVGISTVATGGIGGVHRDFARTFDISADLWELVKTPVTIVSSGFKSVLDIPATVEWLETHSMPVFGYQTEELPAFYGNKSGIQIPSIASEDEYVSLATLCRSEIGFKSAIIVAVPVPQQHALDVEEFIDQAVKEAAAEQISGKALTPYLLRRIAELSGGKTIDTNLALLENNCAVAARLTKAAAAGSARKCGFNV